MKTNSTRVRLSGLVTLTIVSAILVAHSQPDSNKAQTIPTIVMDQVPLLDAIRNLARQAHKNYIIDPQVLTNFGQTVSVRLQNKTAEQALNKVLTDHELVMVENPATSVARIAHQKQNVKAVDPKMVGQDTSQVIPLISMEEVPLADAIQNLARQAGLDVTVDPKISGVTMGANGAIIPPPTLSVRWQNVTPKQALTAVIDNYQLVMSQDGASTRIAPKEQSNAK